jgi:hypothetical protein
MKEVHSLGRELLGEFFSIVDFVESFGDFLDSDFVEFWKIEGEKISQEKLKEIIGERNSKRFLNPESKKVA